jgi:hypothetical protein
MILGNHDDVFIEQYAKDEFETIFSLARETNQHFSVSYKSYLDQEEGHKYAAFLAQQPLVKEVTTSGKKYLLVHAWMRHGDWRKKRKHFEHDDLPTGKDEVFFKRMCLLWERDCDEYSGEIDEWYEPANGEILIHGHSVTTREKSAINRGFSPGKVWDMGASVNIDCGLGNRLSDHDKIAVKYGNLAAYNMDTGEVEYLYDIPDDYPSLKEEYADERLEREKAELLAKAAKDVEDRKKVEHLRKLFFDNVHDIKDDDRLSFNFYNDNFCYRLSSKLEKFADFDLSKDIPMAYKRNFGEETLYIYSERIMDKWVAIPLPLRYYRLINLNGSPLLFGMSDLSGQYAEVSIDDATYGDSILRCKFKTLHYVKFKEVVEGREKFKAYTGRDGKERHKPNGLATCDFFYGANFYSIRVIKNPDDIIIAQITDGNGNILEEFIRSCSRYWHKG